MAVKKMNNNNKVILGDRIVTLVQGAGHKGMRVWCTLVYWPFCV